MTVGLSKENTARHLHLLMTPGLVSRGRGKLYQIPAALFPEPEKPVVDCGLCVLRLDQAG